MKYNIPLTNYSKGRNGYKVEAVVIHIQQGTMAGTAAWFGGENNKTNPMTQSSAHIGVGKDGRIDEYVDTEDTAYHAGRIANPTWRGMKKNLIGGYINPNYYTLGIECEGMRGDIYTEAQMQAICAKVKEWSQKYGFPINNDTIVSHNEITIDKEDMKLWTAEIVKRCHENTVVVQPPKVEIDRNSVKQQIIALLTQL